MAKLLRRMGTEAIKFQFGIVLANLTMSIPVTGLTMCVRCVRGAKQTKSIDCEAKDGKFVWDQASQRLHPMLMVNTMYRNKSGKGDYQKKTAQLVVKQKLGKDYKTVGQVEINLADYLPFGEAKDRSTESTIPLSKCSDKRALLTFSIHCRLLHKAAAGDVDDDTVSRMEGMDSVGGSHADGDPEADLKEADEALQRKEQRGFGVVANGSRAAPIQSFTVGDDELDEEGRRRSSTVGSSQLPKVATTTATTTGSSSSTTANGATSAASTTAAGKSVAFSVPSVTEEDDEDDEDDAPSRYTKTRVDPLPKSTATTTPATTTTTRAASPAPAPAPAPTPAPSVAPVTTTTNNNLPKPIFASTSSTPSSSASSRITSSAAAPAPAPQSAPAKLPPPIKGATNSPMPSLPTLAASPPPSNSHLIALTERQERELGDARDEIRRLQDRIRLMEDEQKREREEFTSARNHAAEKLEQLEADYRSHQTQIDRILEENGLLRERLEASSVAINRLESEVKSARRDLSLAHGEVKTLHNENDKLRERQIRFDIITADERAQKKWKAEAATKSLEKKIAFYEQQLREADDTLVGAKQALGTTSQVLMKEVAALETQLSQTKRLLEESLEGKSATVAGAAAMDKKLQRAIRDQMKLSEALNSFEVKLSQKTMELAASEEERQRLHDLLRSRGMLVPRAPNAPPPAVSASTSSIGRGTTPAHVFGTPIPAPTAAAAITSQPNTPQGSGGGLPHSLSSGSLSRTSSGAPTPGATPSGKSATVSNAELMAALAAGHHGSQLPPAAAATHHYTPAPVSSSSVPIVAVPPPSLAPHPVTPPASTVSIPAQPPSPSPAVPAQVPSPAASSTAAVPSAAQSVAMAAALSLDSWSPRGPAGIAVPETTAMSSGTTTSMAVPELTDMNDW